MMALRLGWMRDDAPYMAICTLGLLSVLCAADREATAAWVGDDESRRLEIDTRLDAEACAVALAQAPLPDVSLPPWPTRNPQALGPSLATTARPLDTYRHLVDAAGEAERRLLRAVATDQMLTKGGVPARTRLLRGAKSDLSAFKPLRSASPASLADELRHGPSFQPGGSGAALGLVPEVQTFGGTTGRDPESTGAVSPLLSRLLRHGILALPPSGASRRGKRVVGGPLVTEAGELSWPRWTMACGPRELRAVYSLATVHAAVPDAPALRARGVDAVFRSAPEQLSTTVAVFRWGRRVA